MQKHLFCLAVVVLTSTFFSHARNADDLFISEYAEGSSNNKYLEIYNGTGVALDLGDYKIHIFSNGNGDLENPSGTIELSGTLMIGDVLVLAHTSAEIYSGSVVADGSLNFNGNDAIGLYKISAGNYIDVFGAIGDDPGAEWSAGDDLSTQDHTLVRNEEVHSGATIDDNADDFNTLASEWTSESIDFIGGLGQHPNVATSDESGPGIVAELNLWPNPAQDVLFVESNRVIRSCRFYDATGQLAKVIRQPANGAINISTLISGLYFLKVEFEDGSSIRKKILVK
jgi:predicted extracellular nuclease